MSRKRTLQAKKPTRRVPTWERQRRTQRWALRGGIFVIALVLAIVVFGYYDTQLRPGLQPALSVDGKVYKMAYLVDLMRYSSAGGSQSLQPSDAAGLVWQANLIEKGAAQLKITVDEKDVTSKLEAAGVPLKPALVDATRAQLLRDKIIKDYYLPQAPEKAPQLKAQMMLLATQEDAAAAAKKLAAGEKFADVAKLFAVNSLLPAKWNEPSLFPRGVFTDTLDEKAFALKPGETSQPLLDSKAGKVGGYWLLKVLERQPSINGQQPKMKVQRMLLGTQEEAADIKRQSDAGADFAALAEELSQDQVTSKRGGNLSDSEIASLPPNQILTAQDLPVNATSDPLYDSTVATLGAYWIVRVQDGPQEQDVSEDNRNLIAQNLYGKWFAELTKASKFENLLNPAKSLWAAGKAGGSYELSSAQ